MGGDASEHIGQPSVGIDVVHLGGDDQAVHGRGSLAAPIGSAEQPGLTAERDAAQRALGGVVAEANSAVVEEQGEGGPAPQHVSDGLVEVVGAGEAELLFLEIAMQRLDNRPAQLLTYGAARFGGGGR